MFIMPGFQTTKIIVADNASIITWDDEQVLEHNISVVPVWK